MTKVPDIQIDFCEGPVAMASLVWPGGCGAEASFVGRTRQEIHQTLGQLIRLEYEIHLPMARKCLHELVGRAIKDYHCQAVRAVHSCGAVAPGQASVVIQVATPHRGEAFEACRFLIDTLKHELPIWKREIWEHGQTFVQGCCAHHAESETNAKPESKPEPAQRV